MKKQAIAFFTMFSLVMMLAIYYVTLPEEDAKVSKKEQSVIANLEKDDQKSKEEEKEKNDDIISDPETEESKKNEAIIKNEEIKENDKKENEYSAMLKDAGYENHVEIKEKTVYITILNQKEEGAIASKVLKSIYGKVGSNYFIELSFKS